MYTLIAQGRRPSVRLLMNRLGISKRTVFRYLRIIDTIDRITYDPKQKGYAFVEGNRADKLRLSHDELAVVLAAGEAVSHLGKSFGERFRRLISNLDLAQKPESGLIARLHRCQFLTSASLFIFPQCSTSDSPVSPIRIANETACLRRIQ